MTETHMKRVLLAAVFAVLGVVAFFTVPAHTDAAINPQINFQGKLTNADGTNVTDGTYAITFSIYSVSSAGTAIWTETQSSVTVSSGIFQVSLGSVTALPGSVNFASSPLYLGVKVGADAEMTPRIQFTAAPYAFNASNADTATNATQLGGIASSGYVQLSPSAQQAGNINISGSVSAGSSLAFTAASAASIQSASSQALTITGNAASTFSTSAGQLTLQSGSGTISFGTTTAVTSTGNMTFSSGGTMSIVSATTNAVSLDSGTTGAVNVGTGAYAKTITIGSASATAVNVTGTTITQTVGGSSTAAFVVTDGTVLLGVDSTNNKIYVGSTTADTSQVLFQPDSFSTYADTAACTTTNNQGAMYYNTATGTMRGCINGNWEDLTSTGGLGLLAFGVVPDSSNAGSPGDLAGITQSNSPCKVYWSAATSVTVAPCYAYSGGRKVSVPSTVLSTSSITASYYANVCLNSSGTPVIMTANAADSGTAEPTWSANNPLLCLATLQMSTTAGTITNGKIYDTRTFTTTDKTFATSNTAVGLGFAVIQSATANLVTTTATAATGNLRGVVVAYSGAVSTTTANVILAVNGPQWVKATGVSTVAQDVETTTTAGYTTSIANAAGLLNYYNLLGVATRTIDTSCTSATTCQYSQFLNPLSIR